ncbi:hypothetical protein Back11_00350 [Paenibacillus baekrokdamisoli]|uniref:Uncharacterized protein n=1 Tax=Paenibacillus baekrokdamisoli TaxID=1712516 RepID=A0A3G9II88_9BACL|nr:hypothetical protein [Paenibacillus baekrokdamisoli]MBB3069340.1 hypothetical protein [Paenibacillus baekrokdamisoli]BBH18690.1 hypothetical protein Back11_00350 [Paenibacillus baekrokdamisoli]
MKLVHKEWEARIELIRSIARSQQAVARILDSVADVSEHSPEMAKSIRDNIASLTAMQLTMAETVAEMRIKMRRRKGDPAKPWLKSDAYIPVSNGIAIDRR